MNTPNMDLDAENRYRAYLIELSKKENVSEEDEEMAIDDLLRLTHEQDIRTSRWIMDYLSGRNQR